MVYTPQVWLNGSTGNTPLNATRLTNLEQGLAAGTLSASWSMF